MTHEVPIRGPHRRLAIRWASEAKRVRDKAGRLATGVALFLLAVALSPAAFAQTQANTDAQDAQPTEAADPGETDDREEDAPTPAQRTTKLNPRVTKGQQEPIKVGQPLTYEITFDLPDGYEWLSVRPDGNRFVEFLGSDQPSEQMAETVSAEVSVTTYRPGNYELSGFTVTYVAPDGTQLEETTEPVTVEVASVIANEQDPKLAEPGPFRMVRTHNPIPLYVLLGFIIAAAGFFAARIFRKEEPEPEPTVPLRPAHEVALESLDRLESKHLLEEGRHLEFHMILSAILREFIGRRYAFHAPEMTTTEIRIALREREKEVGAYADEILTILEESDFVKFAKVVPPAEESQRLLDETRTIVEEVAARELEAEEDAAEVPQPLEGELPVGDRDEEPSYEASQASVDEDGNSEGPEDESPSRETSSRENVSKPKKPEEAPQTKKRVAPDNVISLSDGAKKKPQSTEASTKTEAKRAPTDPPNEPDNSSSTPDDDEVQRPTPDEGESEADFSVTSESIRERVRSASKRHSEQDKKEDDDA
jgi:hypothetical protein